MPNDQPVGPIDLNILPPVYRPRVVSPIFKILWVVGVCLLVGAIPLWAFTAGTRQQVRELRTSVASAQKTLVALRTPAAEAITLTEQISQTLEMLEALRAAHETALGGRRNWAPALSAMLAYNPERIRLDELYQNGNELTLTGLSLSRDEVLSYASALDRSGAFEEVAIQSLQVSGEPFHTPTATPTATITPTRTPTITATTVPGAATATPTLQPYDDYEIDDFDPKPISIGETQNRNFNPIYDVDTATFLGKAGRRYCIQAIPQHYGVDTFLEVSVAGAHYANDDCRPGDPGLLACRCPSAEGAGALASLVEVQVPMPTDQQVYVRITNRDQYGSEQRYVLQVLEVAGDAYERDDLVPRPMAVGEVQERTFYPYGDIDRVSFPVKAGRAYEIRTMDLATGVDTVVTVFLGGQVYTNDDVTTGDVSSRVEFKAILDDTASVNITNKGLYGIDMAYKLQVREVGGDLYEPDDFTPRPISPGEEQLHTFYPPGDVDRLEFNIKGGVTYEVKTYNLSVGVDTALTVVADGRSYYNDDVGPGNPASLLTFTARRDGKASITVENREQFGPEAAYSIKVTAGILIPTATPTPDCRDAYEPDDATGRMMAVGEVQERNFCLQGDVDRVVFTAKSGYAYNIETSNLALGVDTILEVQLGANLYVNDDRAPQDPSSRVHLVNSLPDEQPVFVTIRNKGFYGPDKTYTFSVTGVNANDTYEPDDAAGVPIAMGAAQERAFFPAGDVDHVYFTAKPGHRYLVQTTDLAPGVDTLLEGTMASYTWVNDDRYPGDLSSVLEIQNDSGAEQTVMVRVLNKGPFYDVGATYKLQVDDLGTVSGDTFEPDEVLVRYLSVGEGQRHTFHPVNDWDRVFIKVKAGRRYTVFTCGNEVAPNYPVTMTTPFSPTLLSCAPLMPGVDTELVISGPPIAPATPSNDDVLPGSPYRNSRVEFLAASDGEVTVTIYNRGLFGPDKVYYIRAYELPAPIVRSAPSLVGTPSAASLALAKPQGTEGPMDLSMLVSKPLLRRQFQAPTPGAEVWRFVIIMRMRPVTP